MKQEFLDAYRLVFENVEKVQTLLGQGIKKIQQEGVTLEELADACLAIRRTAELMDESRKAINKTFRGLEEALSTSCIMKMNEDNGSLARLTVKTDWVTASVIAESHVPCPTLSKDPVRYAALCKHWGVPDHVAKKGAVLFSWDGTSAALEEEMAEGKPLPEGIKLDDVIFKKIVRLTAKRDLLSGGKRNDS